MSEFLPTDLIREQTAVGALVVFGLLRILAAAFAQARGWPIRAVEWGCVVAAALYCLPQVADLLALVWRTRAATAELEGKAIGCGLALFCAPILSHRIGFE